MEENWEGANGVLGQWPRHGDISVSSAPGHHPKGECTSQEKQKVVHNHAETVHTELRHTEIVQMHVF